MNLLLLSPLPPPNGGIAQWSGIVINELKNNRNIKLFHIDTSPKCMEVSNRSFYEKYFGPFFRIFKYRASARKILKKTKIDVSHVTTSGGNGLIRDIVLLQTLRRAKVPTVLHLHFGSLKEHYEANDMESRLLKKAIQLSSAIVVLDADTYNYIRKDSPDTVVKNIANPIDKRDLPKPCSKKEKIVSFVGWLVKTKGVEELIEAWNVVGKEFPDYTLQLIGPSNPEYAESLEEKVHVPNVKMIGELPHDKALIEMNKSEILVLPSYTEGFPNVVLEAMALKTTVIASDVGAIKEMIGNQAGMLVRKKSVDDIINALKECISNDGLRRKFADTAYAKVVNNYEVSKVMNCYLELYEKMIGGGYKETLEIKYALSYINIAERCAA